MWEQKNGRWRRVKEKGSRLREIKEILRLLRPIICFYLFLVTFLAGMGMYEDYLMEKYPDRVIKIVETECESCRAKDAEEDYYRDAYPLRNF